MKEVLITSSVLIVVLLILRAVFAKKVRRTLIYSAWALVALRLLIPVQIGHLPFSVLNLFQPATETVTQVLDTPVVGKTEQDAYQQVLQDYVQDYIEKEQLEEPFEQPVFTPEVQDHIQSALDQELPKEDIVGSIEKDYAQQEVYVPEVQPQVQQKVEESTDAVTLGQIAAGVWLVGMVVIAIWLAVGNLTIVRSLKRSAKVLAWDSPIPVYVSQKAVSPCLVGLFRPKIYVTPECAEDETVLRHVMTHELTHYAHRDHIWSAVRCLCLCLYWFDPLVWVAALCSRRDCELACDEGALRRLGEDQRIAYGKALLEVVRSTAVPGRLMLTATTMAETKKQLLRRVNFIASRPRWSMIAAVSMVLVCALVAGCVVTGAEVPSVANDPTLPSTETVLDPTEPIVTEPTVTEPTVTEPTVTEPTVTESTVTEPTVTTPTVTEPPVTKPTVTEPTVTTPTVTEPTVTKPTEPTATEPTVDISQKIRQDYLKYYADQTNSNHSCTTQDVNLTIVSNIEGCYILLIGCKCSSYDPQASWDKPICRYSFNLTFFMPSGWHLSVYRRGDFLTMLDLTYEQALPIWKDYYAMFPQAMKVWQQHYPESTEPPLLDLAYRVNADGITCTIIGTRRHYYGEACKSRHLVIPETIDRYQVTGIGSYSIVSSSTSIVIPDTVTTIESAAFSRSTELRSITFGKGLKTIKAFAFQKCTSLESVVIPDSVSELGNSVFEDCTNLTTVVLPEGLTSLPGSTFNRCTKLTNITIPGSVIYIGSRAFYGCTNLTAVALPEGLTTIYSYAFAYCTKLEELAIPNTVETIDHTAFFACTKLRTVYIGYGLKEIGYSAFLKCDALRDIYYNGTIEQWRTAIRVIEPPFGLSLPSSAVIHCLDGDIYCKQP